MPRLQRNRIQVKLSRHGRTFAMVPAVRQQDPAYIEEDYVEGEHRRLYFISSVD
jgi:hypothetical protein